jgi:hypothetical protein
MDRLKSFGILNEKLIFFSILLLTYFDSPLWGQNVQSPILMAVNVDGDEAFNERLLKQLGQLLVKELNQFVLPVLPLEDRDKRLDDLSDYQAYLPLNERWSEENPRPEYWCSVIVTDHFISSTIINFENEALIAEATVKTRKNLERQIKQLASELILDFIKNEYGLEIGKMSLMGVHVRRKVDYTLKNPAKFNTGNIHWLEINRNTTAPYVDILRDTQVIQLGPYQGVKPQSIQHWKIKKGRLDRRSLVPMRNSLNLSTHYFSYLKSPSIASSFEYLFNVNGKFSAGAGLTIYPIPTSIEIQGLTQIVPSSVAALSYLFSPRLLMNYQHYSSRNSLFFGGKLSVAPVDKGGSVTSYLGYEKIPWLQFQVSIHNFTTSIPACAFNATNIFADRFLIEERFFLLSTGIQITADF